MLNRALIAEMMRACEENPTSSCFAILRLMEARALCRPIVDDGDEEDDW